MRGEVRDAISEIAEVRGRSSGSAIRGLSSRRSRGVEGANSGEEVQGESDGFGTPLAMQGAVAPVVGGNEMPRKRGKTKTKENEIGLGARAGLSWLTDRKNKAVL